MIAAHDGKVEFNTVANNTHAKISASSLAESTSINPNRAESWNWVQKVEINLIDTKAAKARQTKWRPLSKGLERTKTSINAKLDQFNENYQCIN